MKKFDLQAALKGAAVVTRQGDTVEQLTHFSGIKSGCSVVGVINGVFYHWFLNGSFVTPNNAECGRRANQHTLDLFMGPEKRYQNVYQRDNGTLTLSSLDYESEAQAVAAAKGTSLKLIQTVSFEV